MSQRFGTHCSIFIAGVNLPVYTAYEDGKKSIPKRRHIKFRRRGITQKKEYNSVDVLLSLLNFENFIFVCGLYLFRCFGRARTYVVLKYVFDYRPAYILRCK